MTTSAGRKADCRPPARRKRKLPPNRRTPPEPEQKMDSTVGEGILLSGFAALGAQTAAGGKAR